MSNAGFKALFGDMNNKEAVISIINAFLPSHRKVVDIDYLPTEHQGTVIDVNKDFQYDFMCRDSTGIIFIVEMQRYNEENWFKRCVSYACRSYDRQNRKGEGYDVPPVYLIGLMGIEVEHEDPDLWDGRYISEYTFREKYTNELLDETIVIIFAELARFHKTEMEECNTEQDKMMYLLKNMGKLHNQPDWLQNEEYNRIFDACEVGAFSEDKRIKYDKDMNDERKQQGIYAAYKKMGLEAGMKEGLEAGMKEGMEKGVESAVRKFHASGMTINQIASIMEMDVDAIEKMVRSSVELLSKRGCVMHDLFLVLI